MLFDFQIHDGGVVLYDVTVGVLFLAGFVPGLTAELYLIALSSVATLDVSLAVVPFAVLGQMGSKLVLYYAGNGFTQFFARRYKTHMDRVYAYMKSWRYGTDTLVFVSSLTGMPPFVATTIVVGGLGWSVVRFILAGSAGRTIKFGAAVIFSQIVKSLL